MPNLIRSAISLLSLCLILSASGPALAEPASNSAATVQALAQRAPKGFFAGPLSEPLQLLQVGKYDAVIAAIPETLKGRAARPDKSYVLQGLAQQALGQYKPAILSYRLALQTKPSNSDTLYFLALAQQADGSNEAALQSVDEALFFAKYTWVKLDEILFEKGFLLSLVPNAPKATEALAQAIKLNPQNTSARVLLSRLHSDSGNRAEALRVLREGTSLQPDHHELRLALAKALVSGADRKLNKSDIDESVKIAGEVAAASSDEKAKEASVAYVRSLIAAGNLDTADQAIQSALKRFPADAEVQTLSKQLSIEKEAQAAVLAGKSTPVAGS
ncbi:MAG: tetratricopeptide repeat protein [Deltaproteobacteria bacterium]|nr:tetratricopeptide repeat protein [Deltaproteobacteria bacterium]